MRARRTNTLSGLLAKKRLEDRRPLLTLTADKWAVREYITTHVGENYLAPLLASGESPGDIDWAGLPREYVAKVNHGSGGLVLVTGSADASERPPSASRDLGWVRLRVRPEHADPALIADLLAYWLALDYSWASGHRSIAWCYANIPRKVVVEELLRDVAGRAPREYRLFVIGGRVRFLQVEMREGEVACTAVMSSRWEQIPVRFLNPQPLDVPPRPATLEEMVGVAEALGEPLGDFVRVDLYDLEDRLVVGELTHYPYGGRLPVRPRSYDRRWARHWPAERGPGEP